MPVRALSPLLALTLLAAPGCGALPGFGESEHVSCNYPDKHLCIDSEGVGAITKQSVETTCTSNQGVARDQLCDRAGALGGCRLDFSAVKKGQTSTSWYYAGAMASDGSNTITIQTREDVMAVCPTHDDQSFVEP